MRSKFFVIGTAVVALALVASVALVNLDQDIAGDSAGGRVLGVTTIQGVLKSKQAAANGTVSLVVVVSGRTKSAVTVNTTLSTRFLDKNGVAIALSALAAGHSLEITGAKQRVGFVATLVKDLSYAVNKNKIEVSKNTAVSDGTVANPTGMLRATLVKVASFIITAPVSDDALVDSVVLRDASGACTARYVDNIVLRGYANQQSSTVIPSAACPAYAFSFRPGALIRANTRYVVDVLADLTAVTPSPMPLFTVEQVNAVSDVTGNDMSLSNLHLPLQADYIAGGGTLAAQTAADSPPATNYIMGATDQVVARFKLSAGPNEAVHVKQLTVSFLVAGNGAGSAVRNVRVVDDLTEAQIGSAVPALSDTVAGASTTLPNYKHATFYSDTLSIPAGTSKTIALKVDFTSYMEGGFTTTGQTVTPAILSAIGSANPIVAAGAASGDTVAPAVVSMGAPAGSPPGSYGAALTLYRQKLTVAWIPDSPTGASAPSASQVVGKIMITNLANAGLYMAQIKYMNPELISTFSMASGTRYLTVYKDNLTTTPLGQVVWSAAPGKAQLASFTDSAMTDVDISAGASKTFFITLDTTDATANGLLSIRLPPAGIHWTDGVTSDITAMGGDLPLVYRTMNY
ncbi:MAG: hypothetical protein HY983_04550 [Candidatus Magasanikbacteria bacterium]|nr:hypothetical protein [Candidatus Magasanikbacteria bacterium]